MTGRSAHEDDRSTAQPWLVCVFACLPCPLARPWNPNKQAATPVMVVKLRPPRNQGSCASPHAAGLGWRHRPKGYYAAAPKQPSCLCRVGGVECRKRNIYRVAFSPLGVSARLHCAKETPMFSLICFGVGWCPCFFLCSERPSAYSRSVWCSMSGHAVMPTRVREAGPPSWWLIGLRPTFPIDRV